MPLQKLQFRPGLNREGTDYSNEGGWYDGDKVRFRSGFPEKIGGWTQVSDNQYSGVCRSLWIWSDGDAGTGNLYFGVGTNTNYYIFFGGVYNNITPFVYQDTLTNPFTTELGAAEVTVTDPNYSPSVGDVVIFSGGTDVGGVSITGSKTVLTTPSTTTYTVLSNGIATSSATGGGTVTTDYEFPAGSDIYTVGTGWGAGPWGGVFSPARTILPLNSFATTIDSSEITVTQTNNGLADGDSIVIFNATAVGGISADILNSPYVVSNAATNTYTITLPDANAGSFSTGQTYVISYVGTTDFTAIGASANTVGVTFTATGPGSGDGTASITATSTATGGGRPVILSTSGDQGWGDSYSSGVGNQLRLWSNDNYGQDLVLAPRGGPVFYWTSADTVSTRAILLSSLANETTEFSSSATFTTGSSTITVDAITAASIYPYMYITGTGIEANTQVSSSYITGDVNVSITLATTDDSSGDYAFSYAGDFVPNETYQVVASAIQEFVICFGANAYVPNDAATTFNPMLVRWSDQANALQWVPQLTNQSGEYLLTNGSYIMAARNNRQEILVWTDSCIYSMQYLGAPYVWGFQALMDNISVMSPNSMITVNNITYWMGADRFYMYTGRVEVLPCALRQYIFADINQDQAYQVFAGANEAFNEVWWFYVSQSSANTVIDKYIIYNYLDRVWYYGSMGRTAWLQTGVIQSPVAADYNHRLLYHEIGCDDLATSETLPIACYVQSSDFDIGDGHNFGFVWRILPDVNFNGSSTNNPTVTMTVRPRQNSGTAYGTADSPQVQSAQNYTVLPQYTIQQFTGQVYTRLRGRQMAFRIESDGIGVAWQLGSPRIDIRPDGRR
jgi:hypothetical protein